MAISWSENSRTRTFRSSSFEISAPIRASIWDGKRARNVQRARNLSSLGHPDLGPGADTGEHLHSDLPRLDGVVDVRSGDGKGEVDELEGERKEPVLVRDGGGLFGREVLAAEDAEGGLHVEVSHLEEVPVDGPTRPKGKGSGRR
jgi:hypothetical protein